MKKIIQSILFVAVLLISQSSFASLYVEICSSDTSNCIRPIIISNTKSDDTITVEAWIEDTASYVGFSDSSGVYLSGIYPSSCGLSTDTIYLSPDNPCVTSCSADASGYKCVKIPVVYSALKSKVSSMKVYLTSVVDTDTERVLTLSEVEYDFSSDFSVGEGIFQIYNFLMCKLFKGTYVDQQCFYSNSSPSASEYCASKNSLYVVSGDSCVCIDKANMDSTCQCTNGKYYSDSEKKCVSCPDEQTYNTATGECEDVTPDQCSADVIGSPNEEMKTSGSCDCKSDYGRYADGWPCQPCGSHGYQTTEDGILKCRCTGGFYRSLTGACVSGQISKPDNSTVSTDNVLECDECYSAKWDWQNDNDPLCSKQKDCTPGSGISTPGNQSAGDCKCSYGGPAPNTIQALFPYLMIVATGLGLRIARRRYRK